MKRTSTTQRTPDLDSSIGQSARCRKFVDTKARTRAGLWVELNNAAGRRPQNPVFLASRESSFITGTSVHPNGGEIVNT